MAHPSTADSGTDADADVPAPPRTGAASSMRSAADAHTRPAHASLFSSIANLTNTQIGAAMLSLPHAIASTGLLFGLALVVLCAGTSALGLYLLTRCADRLGGRRTSFFEIARRTVPGGAKWFDAAIALKCFGVSIGYLIICGQLMPQVVISFTKALHHDIHAIPDVLLERSTWILLLMVLLIPFCFLRRLDSLRHTSYLSLLAVLYLVVIVLTYALVPSMRASLPPRRGEIHLITFDAHLISIFPVFVFAFTCAQNVFPVFNELKRNTESRVNRVIGASVGTAGLVYMIVGGFGYCTFGGAVADNIITMYPSTNLFVCFGRLSIVTLTLFSYPLQIHPCRASLDKVLFSSPAAADAVTLADAELDDDEANDEAAPFAKHANTPSAGPSSSSSPSYRDDEPEADADADADVERRPRDSADVGVSEAAKARRRARWAQAREKRGEIPLGRWCILTASLLSSTFIVSMLVSDLGLVLGVVGSVGSTTISFILPGILYAVMHKDDPPTRVRLYAKLLALWGVIVMVVSLTANILKIIHGPPASSHAAAALALGKGVLGAAPPTATGGGAAAAALAAAVTSSLSKAEKLYSLGVVMPLTTAAAPAVGSDVLMAATTSVMAAAAAVTGVRT